MRQQQERKINEVVAGVWNGLKRIDTWCCIIHTKGCGSIADVPAAQYDCQSSLVNFVKAWSDSKKSFCCSNQGKGCIGDLTDAQAANLGYGAGAEYGDHGAPVAAITR